MMKKTVVKFLPAIFMSAAIVPNYFPQTAEPNLKTPSKEISVRAANNQNKPIVSRERRQQAYAKLAEAQKYIWSISRTRSQTDVAGLVALAKKTLEDAVVLNPELSEAYTALAEIAVSPPYSSIETGIALAQKSISINRDNFGAHRVLARLLTIKSRPDNGAFDVVYAQKAIDEWKEVARLDPRNAEAWAFLSDFYARTKNSEGRISALKNWTASAQAIDFRFYRSITGSQDNLSPEAATVKLGAALLDYGKFNEAVTVLNRAVSDDPQNEEVITLLRQAILRNNGEMPPSTIESLQQAVYANPSNISLITLLAETQQRMGKSDQAIDTIRQSIKKSGADKNSIANLQIALGDIYTAGNHSNEAISSYEDALQTFGVNSTIITNDNEREFATKVFEKMIATYKNAGRINEAKATIQRARLVLGRNDLFADKQLVTVLRENGENQTALDSVRALRSASPDDDSLLRTEANLLTDMGRIDDAVRIIKKSISDNAGKPPSPYTDDFSSYIFISGLYVRAGRGKDAIRAAEMASKAAKNEEMKQFAAVSLATAQNLAGNFDVAETSLRGLLKKNPTNPIALNNLGYFLLERNKNIQEAHDFIEEAVKIDPTNYSYLDSFGWAKFKLGKFSESERFLKEALRFNPTSNSVYEHLGELYRVQGKNPEARAAFTKALKMTNDNVGIERLKTKLQFEAAESSK